MSEDGTKKVPSPLQTEEGTDTTEKKDDQGVTGGAAAGSSQDVKREDPETEDTKREDTKTEDAKKDDATETREVKEETKVDSQTTHTPGPRPKTLRPTPKEGSWWSSSPLRQWYDGNGSSEGNWWTSAWSQRREPFQNRWNWARDGQWSWAAPSRRSSGSWEGSMHKVRKVTTKETGVATDVEERMMK